MLGQHAWKRYLADSMAFAKTKWRENLCYSVLEFENFLKKKDVRHHSKMKVKVASHISNDKCMVNG